MADAVHTPSPVNPSPANWQSKIEQTGDACLHLGISASANDEAP